MRVKLEALKPHKSTEPEGNLPAGEGGISDRKVIFVTHRVPSENGTGSSHRTYQILHDLEEAVGQNQVAVISAAEWLQWRATGALGKQIQATPTPMRARIRNRALRYIENPFKLVIPSQFSTRGALNYGFASYYLGMVQQMPRPSLVVFEHTNFSELIALNNALNIPSVMCPQNFDSLTNNLPILLPILSSSGGPMALGGRLRLQAVMTDFSNELRALARSSERLMISRVEVGFLGGLGMSSEYYPYLPVGAVRRDMEAIRRQRETNGRESGMFLMLGSALHKPTEESFRWLIYNAHRHGLPPGVRIVIAGAETDTRLSYAASVPGIDVRGWVAQDDLRNLLSSATAVLVPQRLGFGALTRLPEVACAGVPSITSRHPTYALTLPPGASTVGDSWAEWYAQIEQATERVDPPSHAYAAWEANQPCPLADTVQRLLGKRIS